MKIYSHLNEYINGALRHALTAIGGFMLAMGYVDAPSITTMLQSLDVIVGAVITLVGLAGSIWNKNKLLADDAIAAPR